MGGEMEGENNLKRMSHSRTWRVLVVEDSPTDAELLRRGLERVQEHRYQLTHVMSLTEAVDVLSSRGEQYDVVLLDLGLPDANGLEALVELSELFPWMPIIVLSSRSSSELATLAQNLGALDFLQKETYSPALLDRCIKYAIRRKQSDELLQETQMRHRLLEEHVSDLLLVFARSGATLYASGAHERLLGKGPEAIGDVTIFDCLHPEDEQLLSDVLDELGEDEWHTMRMRVVRPGSDPEEIVVEVAINRLGARDSALDEPTFMLSMHDVTAQQQLELQLERAQKMEIFGQLTGGIAHDFNNSLSVILSCAQMVKRELGAEHDLYEDLVTIEEAASRAANLTRQLLTFNNQQPIRVLSLDMCAKLAAMEVMVRGLLGEGVGLDLKIPASAHYIKSDSGQFEQLIMNLIVNAREAMPMGGMLTLEAGADYFVEGDLPHPDAQPGFYHYVRVADTGVGMTPELLHKIFEPFFTTKGTKKATGLGLSTAYAIVKQRGGFILVKSQPKVGTSFYCYFPAVSVPEHTGKVEDTREVKRPLNVLFVEDDPAIRFVVPRILNGKGLAIDVAESFEHAVSFIEEARVPYDLMLSDIILPDGCGLDLLPLIDRERTKYCFITGHADEVLSRYGFDPSSFPTLFKPFSNTTLIQFVEDVLGGRAS